MEAVSDVYTIPQEHLDFCETIGQIARERIAPRSAEIGLISGSRATISAGGVQRGHFCFHCTTPLPDQA